MQSALGRLGDALLVEQATHRVGRLSADAQPVLDAIANQKHPSRFVLVVRLIEADFFEHFPVAGATGVHHREAERRLVAPTKLLQSNPDSQGRLPLVAGGAPLHAGPQTEKGQYTLGSDGGKAAPSAGKASAAYPRPAGRPKAGG